MKEKVVLGLSGGVDSAVAARLLLEQGYEVYGHWLDIGLGGGGDAEAAAAVLGIPFSKGDIRQALEEQVCRPFEREYLAGRTPLPCALCNPAVKFPALWARAAEVGARLVATGHYARIGTGSDGAPVLQKGRPANDQSYLLARLPRDWLSRILFPLGELEKTRTRALARDYGLPAADKPDSMEVCFIPDGDYAAWMDRRGETPPPGDFVDRQGHVLGRHKGFHHYTIGQRRGLNLPAETRLYVSEIRPETNEVVLSDGSDLNAARVWCDQLNLLAPLPEDGEVSVRLRHSKVETAARLTVEGDAARLELHTPARAPTPGQLAVFYQGETVVGSGWITRGERLDL